MVMELQVHKCMTLVPGKAIGGIIDLCKHAWSPEVQQLLPELHADVVQSLRQQDARSDEQEKQMQSHLTRLKQLLSSDRLEQTQSDV